MAPPRDTSAAAYAEQIKRLRAVGPAARLAMAIELSDAVQDLTVAARARRHPKVGGVAGDIGRAPAAKLASSPRPPDASK